MSEKQQSLITMRPGEKVIIKEIAGGSSLKRRLNEMGLNRGTEISVIRNDGWGPVLIALSGSRIALGRQMAGKIFVEKVAQ